MFAIFGAEDSAVIVALITAVPAGLAAWAALRTKKEVKTSNGRTIGQRIEQMEGSHLSLRDGQEALFLLFVEHTEQDAVNFEALRSDLAQLRTRNEQVDGGKA